MKQVGNRHLPDLWAVLVQGHGRIIAHDFCVAHREANSGLSTLNRTKSILSIYHQQRQLQKQRGMCLNDTYPFCQQPLSSNCHSICFSKPVLWAATPGWRFSPLIRIVTVYPKICSVIVIGISTTSSRRCDQPPAVRAAPDRILPSSAYSVNVAWECLARRKQKTRIADWPTPWPTNKKTGRKQRRKAYLRVRKSRDNPALFSQNPSEGCPIESSHAWGHWFESSSLHQKSPESLNSGDFLS